MSSYFDDVLCLDFMKYSYRKQPLLPETISGMIDAYNSTPENFGVPSDEIIHMVIELVDKQMERDSVIEDGIGLPSQVEAKKPSDSLHDSPTWTGITM